MKNEENLVTKTEGWGWRVGNGLGAWDGFHTLLYMEWMVNRDLLYSIGKYTQYSVITYIGMHMCVYI